MVVSWISNPSVKSLRIAGVWRDMFGNHHPFK